MSVNDVLAAGGTPLLFLDYIASESIDHDKLKAIVAGVADGCVSAGARLIGGETAEMPDVYRKGGFDLAGFCTGAAERDALLNRDTPEAGDIAIGIAAHSIHANGFSLVRKIIADHPLTAPAPFAKTSPQKITLGDALLLPTAIYADAMLPLLDNRLITSAAHITGGGLVTNPPRVFTDTLCLRLDMTTWQLPSIFAWLQHTGDLPDATMLEVFNCGVGMVVTARPDHADQVLASIAKTSSHHAWRIGRLAARDSKTAPQVIFDNLAHWSRQPTAD